MNAAALRWAHRNLFAKPFDTALSLIVIPVLAWVLYAFAVWVLAEARWEVIGGSLKVLMTGIYPAEQLWRAWFALAMLCAMFGAGLGLSVRPGRTALTVVALAGAVVAASAAAVVGAGAGALTAGSAALGIAAWVGVHRSASARRLVLPGLLAGVVAIFAVLSPPGFELWGGLLLSVVLTITVSILTVPFGILLALGRQSRIASLRVICTAYIETMRSVPLILVVYWIWIIVPLLAPDASIPSLLRGMAGYALFFAAYVAEYVRSGLQAVPKGQVEAARSLGMSSWTVNVDIVLPQALRVVVPSLVGQILDIFNGATLVFIIGLTDFLRAGQMILADPQNSGRTYEIYVFLFAVYFAIGGAITFASRRLEAHLARGSR
ncbi:amino acid ABC transporter permease [Bosea sp. (in: a-proteobacteria)]|jgi:general L-amino acid transport system permease protein|uniref:amino acid ABC transporter permease n=1 Tax=Bosea sp. (in: a-proteobacteria) TaxID=1871050 RepID=UPI002DDD1DFB|nr:amino acid ABC transporter permease [Bosea sp. (in: a-proteobacteria)]HEV2513306.1 amino acid ABC transporter permease [Bosea sp. (in: a-proteobacteria)]